MNAMPTILIVDDQSTSRKILEQLVITLNEHSEVKSFADPLSALEWVGKHQPDLVLTDYKMPQMDGIEFTRRFREFHADIPVVMVTAVEDKEVRYLALEAGATDFLNKPIDHTECSARCRNLLLLSHHQRIIKNRALLLESKVNEATKEIRIREQETLLRLAKAGEYRDEETGNHVIRMAKFSRLMAEKIGLPESDCHVIEIAAPMHDIGKISAQAGEGGEVAIGDETHIQPRCQISAYKGHVRIGMRVEIGPSCAFYPYNHALDPGIPIRRQPLQSKGGILVGDDVWLGYGVILLDGAEIGDGAAIGAGSVVTGRIPANAIAAGVPARVLRYRAGAAGAEAPVREMSHR